MRRTLVVCVATIALSTAAVAEGLKDATVAFRLGDWKVLRSSDLMTDRASCTGIYKDNFGIQLNSDDLYIRIDGGIESVTLRFDDQPPTKLRLATPMEKKLRSIDVSGSDFAKLKTASRLRYQSMTLVSGIQSGEIDLTQLGRVLDNIAAGCPASTISEKSEALQKNKACSAEVVARMKDQGFPEQKISAICE
jgi:translation initiation factor 1 (eIF-1/SUI1)